MTIKKKETNQWDSQFDMYFRVGVLYLERAHMHKLGLVAKKHRFAGSPFEAKGECLPTPWTVEDPRGEDGVGKPDIQLNAR